MPLLRCRIPIRLHRHLAAVSTLHNRLPGWHRIRNRDGRRIVLAWHTVNTLSFLLRCIRVRSRTFLPRSAAR